MSTDDELVTAARQRAMAGLQASTRLTDNPTLQRRLTRCFQDALTSIDEHMQLKTSAVTPQVLAEDVIDACASEGWDCSLLFWDYENPRYGNGDDKDGFVDEDDPPSFDDRDDEKENPSEAAARIAAQLLQRYEMKPRT